jgi:hypothetical protein
MRAHSLILTIVVIGAACTTGDARDPAIIVRDSSGVTIVENDLTRLDQACSIAAEPTLSIGVLEGEEHYIFGNLAGAVRLSDGRIVVANRATNQIRYFDAAGKFLYASGRAGEGPGEFREPFYLFPTTGDTLYVGDFRPFRFLVFDPNGTWVRTAQMDPLEINTPRSMSVLADGRPVLGFEQWNTEPPTTFPMNMMALRLYDPQGRVLDTIGEYPNGRSGMTKPNPTNFHTSPLFESVSRVNSRGSRIVIGHASRTELVLRGSGDGLPVERIIRWNVGDLSVTAEDIAIARARIAERYDTMPAARRASMQPYRDEELSTARPVADRHPAFSILRIGTDGAIWVREIARPTDTTTTYGWIGFDADGRFRCRLRTPQYPEFYEFGPDYILVQDPDSLDVERVRQFPLRQP